MKELGLRNLINPLLFITSGTLLETFPPDEDDYEEDEEIGEEDDITKTETYEIFQDKINNNVIVYSYNSYDGEEIPTDITESISNSISESPYEYLINILNTTKNTVVYWSQIEGTTSDYTIYYDVKIPKMIDYNSIEQSIPEPLLEVNEVGSYKYTEIKNGKYFKVEC